MCVCVCVERGGGPYLYYLEVGFPPTHIWKVIRCLGSYSPSKCTYMGTRPSSADPTWKPLGLILCWVVDSLDLIHIL